jgi:hypothetical protein
VVFFAGAASVAAVVSGSGAVMADVALAAA